MDAAIIEAPRRPVFWPVVVATLVLLPLTAWIGAYFYANSGPGRDMMRGWLSDRLPNDRVRFDHLTWGPSIDSVTLMNAEIRDLDDAPVLEAGHIVAALDLGELWDGRVAFDGVAVHGFKLDLRWDAAGNLSLAQALAPPSTPPTTGGPAPKRPAPTLLLEQIQLHRGDLSLSGPTWRLAFDDIDADGMIRMDPDQGLQIDADLRGGDSEAAFAAGDRELKYQRVRIRDFSWRDDGFTVDGVDLEGPHGARISLSDGRMGFAGELSVDTVGALRIPGEQAKMFVGALVPDGVTLDGVSATVQGEALAGKIAVIRATSAAWGPVTAQDIALPIAAIEFVPGKLKPSGAVVIEGGRIGRLTTADGAVAEEITLPKLSVRVTGSAEAILEGATIAKLTLPTGVVGRANVSGSATYEIIGGKLSGTIETDQGTIGMDGSVVYKVFAKRLKISMKLGLDGLSGALAEHVEALLATGADHPSVGTRPAGTKLSGFVSVETSAKRKKVDGDTRWSVTTAVKEAQVDMGQRWVFDGDEWQVETQAAPSPPSP